MGLAPTPRRASAHSRYPAIPAESDGSESRLHRRSSGVGFSVTRHRGIPVTTPAQTIADLAGAVSPTQHRRAIRQAEVLGLQTGLDAVEPTRSELEDLFLRLCERHRLPKPEVNVQVGPYEVDFLWRD